MKADVVTVVNAVSQQYAIARCVGIEENRAENATIAEVTNALIAGIVIIAEQLHVHSAGRRGIKPVYYAVAPYV